MTARRMRPLWAAHFIGVLGFLASAPNSRGADGAKQSKAHTIRQLQQQQQRNNHRNISDLLDNLLRGYDNSVRPNFGGSPAVVEVDIMVRSMGPISEVDMTYSMDCYFRQSWVDRRLAFRGGDKETTLALSISMLERIWKPDTYFYNGKQSYLHTITTPNKFVRLYQDGRVLYSSRLTIKAGCPMNLEDFPMDIQRCPLKFGSFGYTTRDVLYRWNSARRVAIAEDMKLSQFDLITTPTANQTDALKTGRGRAAGANGGGATYGAQKAASVVTISEYSMLVVSFHLQRHMGNFLIQVYGPCVLLVVLSWVSFWLNREATADRVSLGITTVLTMTFLGLEARTDLPKVPYPTALDFFVFLSFGFIFATIIQFAVVHYFTKYGSGEVYFSSDFSSSGESSSEGEWEGGEANATATPPPVSGGNGRKPEPHRNSLDITRLEVIPLAPPSIYFHDRRSLFTQTQRHQRRFGHDARFQNRIIAAPPSVVLVPPQQGGRMRKAASAGHDQRPPPLRTASPSPTLCCLVRGDRAAPIRDHPASIGRYDVPPGQQPTASSVQTSPLPQMQQARQPLRRRLSDSIRERFQRRESGGAQGTAAPGTRARRKKRTPRYNSVSKIDRASRVVFPLCFLAINLFYWYSYLARSERMGAHPNRI
ncbi:gamma-aminobutyric acid receptor alpha-like [Ischnura elegans]|uniref:gamma-aminobutyric acid receptor alpha-like n=1 Tax=Ischnura elegans TaxID=197161 RepID=UPI001ED88199|nr:gamma-aminobutyric acid receptor alpha-like [Ischnura elegans]